MIFLLLATVVLATEPRFRECRVSVGEVQSCSATSFTGEAPVERDNGRIYDCTVSVGVLTSCFRPRTGLVVLPRGEGGKHVSCQVEHGIVTRCDATGFTGSAVLWR